MDVASRRGAWIETSVNWTIDIIHKSRPAGARGLKQKCIAGERGVEESRPAGARGLKQRGVNECGKVDLSRPAGARGLKRQ
ncbi:MAG: hypothetical protein FD170_1301 [Bacteroidetes bacterium]|nr:MAG: hypothetical protein FD170_1301 [Bacteroidota bacterium]